MDAGDKAGRAQVNSRVLTRHLCQMYARWVSDGCRMDVAWMSYGCQMDARLLQVVRLGAGVLESG